MRLMASKGLVKAIASNSNWEKLEEQKTVATQQQAEV